MLVPALLLLGTLLLIGLISTTLVPVRRSVAVGCATNLLQIYAFPVLGIYVSVSQLAWLASWRAVFDETRLWRWGWMLAMAMLMLERTISIAWSPNKILGLRYLIYSLPFLFVAHAFYSLTREKPDIAKALIKMLLVASAFEAFLVVVFRLSPAIEFAFLRSIFGKLLIGANAIQAFFTVSPDNVYDPAKAGGVFLNANVAAIFLGLCACSAWGYGRLLRSRLLLFVAALNWVAVLFTGSKAGAIFAIAVPSLIGLVAAVRSRSVSLESAALAIVGAGLVVVSAVVIWKAGLLSHFGHDSVETLNSRKAIWGFAREIVPKHLLLGLGFGGWELAFPHYAIPRNINPNFPPHNSWLLLWSQSGLIAIALALVWVASVGAGLSKVLKNRSSLTPLALGVGGAFAWYVLQGLAENIGVVGEPHMTPLLGALLGNLFALYDFGMVLDERQLSSAGGATASPALSQV